MIYIATHKTFVPPVTEGYIPLQVGASGNNNLGYQTDDTGDSISEKNAGFCELTGLYWIWKNCRDEYKGLVHYRRYFGKSNLINTSRYVYTYVELLDFLEKYDIVLPYKEFFLQNAKEELLVSCCTEDIFVKLRKIIEEKHTEYLYDFDRYFSENRSVLFNMMFCRSELFDQYSEWLFSVLFELEKQVNLESLNDYQKRLFGFLSERLLNVWIRKKQLKCKYVSVVNTEMKLFDRINLIRRRYTNAFRYWLKKKVSVSR